MRYHLSSKSYIDEICMTLYLPYRYEPLSYLNTDTYGINYLVKDRDLDILGVCRIINRSTVNERHYNRLQNVAECAHRLDHENIRPLLDVSVDSEQDSIFIISRKENFTLFEYADELSFLHVYAEEAQVLTVLAELTNAILYVYSTSRRTEFVETLARELPVTALDPLCIILTSKGYIEVDYLTFMVKASLQQHSQFTSAYLCPEMQELRKNGSRIGNLSLSKALTYNVGRLCCELCFAGSMHKAPRTVYETAYMLEIMKREGVYSKDFLLLLTWLTNPCNELRPPLDEILTHPFMFKHMVQMGASEHDRIFRNAIGSTQLILSANANNIEYVRLLLHKQKRLTNHDGATALMAAAILGHLEIIAALIPYESGMQMMTGDTLHGATALILAARNNQVEACKLLAPHEANLRKRDSFTALMEATLRGHGAVVDILIQYEAKAVIKLPNPSDPKNGTTALMLACELYQLPMAMKLLRHEAGLKDSSGYTALHRSAALGLVSAVELLIGSKELGIRDPKGLTALMFAAQYGHYECVKLLAETKEIRMTTDNGWTALLFAISNNHTDVSELLIPLEGDLVLNVGYTPLMCAVEYKQIRLVKILQENLARRTISEGDGWQRGATALMLAAYNNDADSCQALLELEGGMSNTDGMTALMMAALHNCEKALSVLCNSQKEIKVRLTYGVVEGRTALMIAAMNGSLQCVETLVNRKIDVGLQDSTGSTALILAALSGHAEVCKLLVAEEGKMRRKDGFTALMSAAQEGHKECVSVLLSKEGDVHKPGGWTALMSAALKNRPATVQLLARDRRQARRKRESDGVTALMIAVQCGHTECVRILAPIERSLSDKKGRQCYAYAKTDAVRRILDRLPSRSQFISKIDYD